MNIQGKVHYVGVNDRTTTRFEGLWSLPQGVSYNAYLVVGEKVALIDTVEEAFGSRLEANIREIIGDRKVDYLVVNHMEPDHSSSITALRRIYPDLQIVANAKALQMIEGFYGLCGNTVEVKEGDTLDLGGKSLSFRMIPMVHWPETMVSWCPEEQALFSGDAFGCFGALDGGITPGENDIDVLFIYSSEHPSFSNCIPARLDTELNNVAFKNSIGEFTCRTFPNERIVSTDDMFVDSLQIIAEAKEVKRLLVVGYNEEYGVLP